MKKILFGMLTFCLISLVIVNVNFALNGSSGRLSMLTLNALAQIYDGGELGEVTVYCSGSDNDCFLPNGCRCYSSTWGTCPRCGDYPVYYCAPTGTTTDLCGMFEILMQSFPGDHKAYCTYRGL